MIVLCRTQRTSSIIDGSNDDNRCYLYWHMSSATFDNIEKRERFLTIVPISLR